MKSFKAIVHGRVQGVGYRFFVQREAEKLGIIGTVKNLFSGSVEICAKGEDEKIDTFLAKVQKGPMFSYVSDTDIEWDTYEPDKNLDEFRIIF